MNRTALLALALVLAAADPAAAQARGERYNPFSFTPYAGLFRDAYDARADGSDIGWLLGFRAGYHESDRINLHLNLGYSRVNDIATRVIASPIIDAEWVILTAGGDYALVPGNTSIAAGADVGVGWRNTRVRGGGELPPADEGWGAYPVLTPSLVVRQRVSPSVTISLTGQNHIFDVLESARHSQSLTLGLSIR